MTSIDELFKRPSIPGGAKRKLEAARHPSELYKATKLSTNGDVKGSHGREDGETEVSGDNDDSDAEFELDREEQGNLPEDDEEGRFFGGGVSKDTANALDIVESREEEDEKNTVEKFDVPWVRRLGLNFEKNISRNAELRARFENEPQKFMASEADLDAAIKSWSILTEHPELYIEFAKLGSAASLVGLLAHENTDIAIDTIEALAELTDEDVEAEQIEWDFLAETLLDADLITLLVQNFERLDETNESDRNGVYYSLNVVENLATHPKIADKIAEDKDLIVWLMNRLKRKELSITQNKQYAVEVLAILLQSSTKARPQVIHLEAVDTFLQLLSTYRKRDPAHDSEEEEYAENLFNCLTCAVDESSGKSKFVEAEGVELCLIMIKEGKFSKPRALRILDHATSSQAGGDVCARLVDAAGLKPLFGMFMKQQDHTNIEHLLGIFSSLLKSLPGNSAARIRTLAKFMEKDYSKIEKLISLRFEYYNRVSPVDLRISEDKTRLSAEEQKAMADQWLSDRLDAGLFCVQTVDVILAWLVAEDVGARKKIEKVLVERETSLSSIKVSLAAQLSALESEKTEEAENEEEMLRTLMEFLD